VISVRLSLASFVSALVLSGSALVHAQGADTKVYKNPALQLAFAYPNTLDAEDPANTDNYSFRTRFALHPDSDPEHKGADPCSPLLLAVGLGPDVPLDGKKAKPGKQVALQPTGGLTLNEVKHTCLAKDSFNAPDDKTVADLVENARHVDGLKPIARTLSYQAGGAEMLFAASSGRGSFSGTASARINGRIFLWSFSANDLEVFNRMLASKVCFDAPACAAGYTTLVPYRMLPSGETQAVSQ
jgi:hypothetical protein